MQRAILIFIVVLSLLFAGCTKSQQYSENFNSIGDRVWVSPEIVTVPLEDWQVSNGRLECIGERSNMRANLITCELSQYGEISISFKTGIKTQGINEGSAGVSIGLSDNTDNSIKSLCYWGKGINIGVSTRNKLFIGTDSVSLPAGFNFSELLFNVEARTLNDSSTEITAIIQDKVKKTAEINYKHPKPLHGIICLSSNFSSNQDNNTPPNIWYDDIKVEGSMLNNNTQNAWGPILWTMFTQSEGTLKLTAQMPPLGTDDEKQVQLQVKNGDQWQTIDTATIQSDARIAVFKVEKWNSSADINYRIAYYSKDANKKTHPYYYEGTIPRDPVNRPLRIAGLTGQEWSAYPYQPVAKNLANGNPDILFFSGDQIYERNGGYDIIRGNPKLEILNYLGKWYMFGWAFGDVMRNRPTICLPDDHEVFQGNLWGEGGKKLSKEQWDASSDCIGGFIQSPEMIHVVMKTNTAHLPDPYDATPLQNNIPVYFTNLVYGRVSFAIIGDRVFKSGPENVAWWDGRKDHIKIPIKDPGTLEKPELQYLGDRQEKFLENWVKNWKGADMKCVLSQTIFAGAATHHSSDKEFLIGDLDSGGWPKQKRDKALNIIRKAFAYHICGDTHLTSIVQYGINSQRDAGWAFCTPAISVGYERRFLPDTLGYPVVNRPSHNLPNTGEYTDFFKNYMYVYAVGNPVWNTADANRYQVAQNRSSGFGITVFNQIERTIESVAIKFLPVASTIDSMKYFDGWPLKVHQLDNYGRKAFANLPEIDVENTENTVIEITNEATGELEYCVRMKGKTFIPKVFSNTTYTIKLTDTETNLSFVAKNVGILKPGGKATIKAVLRATM